MIYTCYNCVFYAECMMTGNISSASDPICVNFYSDNEYLQDTYEDEMELDNDG